MTTLKFGLILLLGGACTWWLWALNSGPLVFRMDDEQSSREAVEELQAREHRVLVATEAQVGPLDSVDLSKSTTETFSTLGSVPEYQIPRIEKKLGKMLRMLHTSQAERLKSAPDPTTVSPSELIAWEIGGAKMRYDISKLEASLDVLRAGGAIHTDKGASFLLEGYHVFTVSDGRHWYVDGKPLTDWPDQRTHTQEQARAYYLELDRKQKDGRAVRRRLWVAYPIPLKKYPNFTGAHEVEGGLRVEFRRAKIEEFNALPQAERERLWRLKRIAMKRLGELDQTDQKSQDEITRYRADMMYWSRGFDTSTMTAR